MKNLRGEKKKAASLNGNGNLIARSKFLWVEEFFSEHDILEMKTNEVFLREGNNVLILFLYTYRPYRYASFFILNNFSNDKFSRVTELIINNSFCEITR